METITKLESVSDGIAEYRVGMTDYRVEDTGNGIYAIYERNGDAYVHAGRQRRRSSYGALVKHLAQLNDEYSLDDGDQS